MDFLNWRSENNNGQSQIKVMRQDSEMKQEKDTAKEIVSYLDESATKLDTQIVAKLAAARNRAVAAFSARTKTADNAGHSILHLLNDYIHNHRALASTAMVCSVALVAFMVTEQISRQEMVEQGDAFLLGSELPPEAFLDRGFNTWLERTSQH
jgi:hypothetical protein